ncbi:MAG: PKD domain-containing protein [Candidatus Thermoplasmatota archaeon]|nr:PKD domain-containing protein [Candidatus Thermoplasmatota archaeon]
MKGTTKVNLNKKWKLLFIVSILFLFVIVLTGFVSADSMISVESTHESLNDGEQATVTIELIPEVSVKSFEFSIDYNQSLISVSNLSEGSFFNGYTTFSSNGTIDTNNGMISDVYSLIMGEGMVDSEGILYTFTITASDTLKDKTTLIQLVDAGITNETSYLPLTIEPLSLTINSAYDGPHMSSPMPSDQSTDVSTDLTQLQIYLYHTNGSMVNYSITTNPGIGSLSGILSENSTVTVPISGIDYQTTYEWTVFLDDGFTTSTSTFSFTTEDAPEDTDDDNGGSSGGGGGFLPPMPPAEPEDEEDNHPPETPLPPQGFAYVEPGIKQAYMVSSWDSDDDLIRFQIEWRPDIVSNWSDFVSSNESVTLSHVFSTDHEYLLRVRCQDESGLNSSWSDSYEVIVSAIEDDEENADVNGGDELQGITVEVNNETGETQFSFNQSFDLDDGSHFVWDFGDGSVVEGSSPQHTYSKPGTYTVTVMITDKDGQVSMKTYTVTIPEPQQKIDTSTLESSLEESTSFPWIFVLIGIIAAIAGVFITFRFFIEFN